MGGNQKRDSLDRTRSHRGNDTGTLCRHRINDPRPCGASPGGPWDWITKESQAAEDYLSGHLKSIAITTLDLILSLVPLKPDSPYSVALLKHYVEASGDPYELKDIPKDWQDWIVKATAGKIGLHRELSPYNSGIFDLRNSLGHFDVNVKLNQDGTKSYAITKFYQFGFKKHDKAQTGRHGFPLGSHDSSKVDLLRKLLPTKQYLNPGGFKEGWEIRQQGKETILFIPQQVLVKEGKPYWVSGTFRR